jgi:hypothetical protein
MARRYRGGVLSGNRVLKMKLFGETAPNLIHDS